MIAALRDVVFDAAVAVALDQHGVLVRRAGEDMTPAPQDDERLARRRCNALASMRGRRGAPAGALLRLSRGVMASFRRVAWASAIPAWIGATASAPGRPR